MHIMLNIDATYANYFDLFMFEIFMVKNVREIQKHLFIFNCHRFIFFDKNHGDLPNQLLHQKQKKDGNYDSPGKINLE